MGSCRRRSQLREQHAGSGRHPSAVTDVRYKVAVSERDRALGALTGLAVGDALGMPTQSLSPAAIAQRYGPVTGLRDGAPDQPIAPGLPAGTVTDDTEQALLLARLLVEGGGHVEPRAFADALSRWQEDMLARGSADLLGPSTMRAIERLRAGEPVEETGRDGTTNGAAMRIAPVGIACADPDRLLERVVETCLPTHNTTIGIAAAAAVAAAVSAGVGGADLPGMLDAAERAADSGSRHGHWHAGGSIPARLGWVRGWAPGRTPAEIADVVGTSVAAQESVVAAFALLVALGDDPRATLTAAAGLGGDTDTIAAIAGAILGAHHGASALPPDLVTTVLQVNDLDLEPTADALLALRSAS
jgi:ADP-ribosylglycohydrolase